MRQLSKLILVFLLKLYVRRYVRGYIGCIMKKKTIALLLSPIISLSSSVVFADDLMQVYQEALTSDPTYLAAKSTYLSSLQDVPINRAVLLPQLVLNQGSGGSGFLNHTDTSGTITSHDGSSQEGYGFSLALTQQLFNFPAFESLKEAKSTVKSAAATYYAAAQDLMVRVATDYFTVLEDEEVVHYTEANVRSNKRSLDQARQQYKVGLKTLTDVYSAQAAYSSAVSEDVSAKNTLASDKENLRAITGKEYKSLAKLSDDYPLVSPDPKGIDEWVKVAVDNNWQLKATNYDVAAAMSEIKVQWGGHLPTLELDASYSNNYFYQNSDYDSSTGSNRAIKKTAALNMSVPIFEGGAVSAAAKQAEYDYQTAVHNMDLQYRTTVTTTRQDYLNVVSGISAVKADKSAVVSNQNSLKGFEAGYKVGTQTMVDVLNQQSLLFQAQQAYASDRFSYVTNLINLKSDTGTLSVKDLEAINGWLGDAPAAKAYKENTREYGLQTLQDQYIVKDQDINASSESQIEADDKIAE